LLRFIVGLFLILHGLVHLLYAGQSWRLFELQPGMTWPDGSWAFSRLLGDQPARILAGISCVVVASGFTAGGIALLLTAGLVVPADPGFGAPFYPYLSMSLGWRNTDVARQRSNCPTD
jgi:hypothetical protein